MLKIFLALVLVSMSANASTVELQEGLNLLFFGAFGMIIIYNLSCYIFIKDNAYADYLLFHTFVFVIMLFYTGTFDDKLLEYSIDGVPVGIFIFAALALLSFTKNFLDTKSIHINMEKYIKYLQFVLLGLFAVSVFPVSNTLIVDTAIAFIVLLAFGLLSLSLYLSLVKREVYAYFYLLAFSGIFVSIIISFLSYFNLIGLSSDMKYVVEFSLLFEASVFSFALSYRHKETILSLKQNELLFKELSHRVQNNLQSIISILSLQMSRVEELAFKEYLQDTINRIRTISLIHEKLQHSKLVGEVNMQIYLESLLDPYKALHKEINFSLGCDEDIFLSIEKLTPLSLVINELITNSIKHAFSKTQHPSIDIRLHKNAGYTFTYEDNGKGYNEITESLGSLLIKNLSTSQLKGNYVIDSQNRYLFSLRF